MSSTQIDRSYGSTKDQIMEHWHVIEFYAHWLILLVNKRSDNETCYWVCILLSLTQIYWSYGKTFDWLLNETPWWFLYWSILALSRCWKQDIVILQDFSYPTPTHYSKLGLVIKWNCISVTLLINSSRCWFQDNLRRMITHIPLLIQLSISRSDQIEK